MMLVFADEQPLQPGTSIAAARFVRRLSAAVGIVLVLTLSLLLFYRVWVHHQEMELGNDGALVEVVAAPFASEKFTQLNR